MGRDVCIHRTETNLICLHIFPSPLPHKHNIRCPHTRTKHRYHTRRRAENRARLGDIMRGTKQNEELVATWLEPFQCGYLSLAPITSTGEGQVELDAACFCGSPGDPCRDGCAAASFCSSACAEASHYFHAPLCSAAQGGEQHCMLEDVIRAAPGQYASIQAAIDAAPPGAHIRIAAGTFAENLILRQHMTLSGSALGPVPAPTAVGEQAHPDSGNGGGGGSSSGVNSHTVLEGSVTVTHGAGARCRVEHMRVARGIIIVDNSWTHLNGLEISNATGGSLAGVGKGGGVGVDVRSGDIHVVDCTISNCAGTGVEITEGKTFVKDTTIQDCGGHGICLADPRSRAASKANPMLNVDSSLIRNVAGEGILNETNHEGSSFMPQGGSIIQGYETDESRAAAAEAAADAKMYDAAAEEEQTHCSLCECDRDPNAFTSGERAKPASRRRCIQCKAVVKLVGDAPRRKEVQNIHLLHTEQMKVEACRKTQQGSDKKETGEGKHGGGSVVDGAGGGGCDAHYYSKEQLVKRGLDPRNLARWAAADDGLAAAAVFDGLLGTVFYKGRSQVEFLYADRYQGESLPTTEGNVRTTLAQIASSLDDVIRGGCPYIADYGAGGTNDPPPILLRVEIYEGQDKSVFDAALNAAAAAGDREMFASPRSDTLSLIIDIVGVKRVLPGGDEPLVEAFFLDLQSATQEDRRAAEGVLFHSCREVHKRVNVCAFHGESALLSKLLRANSERLCKDYLDTQRAANPRYAPRHRSYAYHPARVFAPSAFGPVPSVLKPPRSQVRKCGHCGESDGAMRMCSRCGSVAYCSRECQTAHWKAHKKVCRAKGSGVRIKLDSIHPNHVGKYVSNIPNNLGIRGLVPPAPRTTLQAASPDNLPQGQLFIFKVCVDMGDPLNRPMLCYDSSRRLELMIWSGSCEKKTELAQLVMTKGERGGIKLYLRGEVKDGYLILYPDRIVPAGELTQW